MKFLREFCGSVAFLSLAFLAFNPHIVVELQSVLHQKTVLPLIETPEVPSLKPPSLPITIDPDLENLPRLDGFEKIAKNDSWVSLAPCSIDIFNPPEALMDLESRENGPLLDTPLTTYGNQTIVNQPTYLFKSKNGVTLKLVKPVIEYYDVSGRNFQEVQNDIFDRRPLEKLRQSTGEPPDSQSSQPIKNKTLRVTRAADIFSPTSLSYTLTGSRDRYRLVVNKTVMTTAYLVTLPRWKQYEIASDANKQKWDDFFCNVAHHELGHLQIRLDILAETLDGYAALPPAQSFDEMEDLAVEYRKKINRRIQARQDAYHIYNGGGMRRGMTERPYAQLPFPWLRDANLQEIQ